MGLAGVFLLVLACLASPTAAFVSSGRLIESPAPAASAMVVKVGVFVRKIYDFDPTTDSFQCTFDLWLTWTTPPARGDGNDTTTPILPTKTIQLSNAIDISGSVLSPAMDSPLTTDNQTFSMLYHAQSRIGKVFNMVGFPVDQHSMDLVIEDMSTPSVDIAYIPDDSQSGFDSRFSIPGWTVQGMKSKAAVHDYGTSFGVFPNGTTFPAVVFSVVIDRAGFLVAWQLVPLIFLLCLSWLALAINPERADSRLALCTTALLTAVFLQQAALSLFNRTYLVLLDNIYIMAYVMFIVNFVIVLMDETHFAAGEAAEAAKEDGAEGNKKEEEERRLLYQQEQQANHANDDDHDGVLYPLLPTDSSHTVGSTDSSTSVEIMIPSKNLDDEDEESPAMLDSRAIASDAAVPTSSAPTHIPYFPPLDTEKAQRLRPKDLFDLSGDCGKDEVVRRIRIRDLLLLGIEVIVTIIVITVLCLKAPGANSIVEQS